MQSVARWFKGTTGGEKEEKKNTGADGSSSSLVLEKKVDYSRTQPQFLFHQGIDDATRQSLVSGVKAKTSVKSWIMRSTRQAKQPALVPEGEVEEPMPAQQADQQQDYAVLQDYEDDELYSFLQNVLGRRGKTYGGCIAS